MIPYFDYRPEWTRIQGEIDEALRRVLASGQLILGPEVQAFEREIAALQGLRGAVGVNSGTDALILALRALEVGSGDEVITVANAGPPTVAAIRAAGAVARFVDVDPETLLMDPSGLERAITSKTRCILPVHLYGQPAPLAPILEIAERHGVEVVEDCAQAQGALYRSRRVGGWGRIGCFSFYPTKNLGAYGDGGICVTDDRRLEERLRMLRMYGFRNDRHSHCEGLNSRLDELQAAILRVKLRQLDRALEERRAIAMRYREALAGSAYRLTEPAAEGSHTYHLFVVRTERRAAVIEALRRAEIGFGIHYEEPVHRMEAYRFLGYDEGDLPVTEEASRRVLSLPIYPGLEEQAVESVIRTLLAAA